MTLETVRDFLGWCTVLNFVFLFIAGLSIGINDWSSRLQSKLFRLTVEEARAFNYKILGIYKVLIVVFNLVPYLALRVIVNQ